MKIQDFYEMENFPSSPYDRDKKYPWYIQMKEDVISEMFGHDVYDINKELADNPEDDLFKNMKIECKLFKNQDGERTVSYMVYSYKDKPFALSITSGRGESDNVALYITDEATVTHIRKHFNSLLIDRHANFLSIYDPNQDIEDLSTEYGYLVHKDEKDNRFKLISASDCFIPNESNPIQEALYVIDAEEMRAKFESVIRPMTKNISWDNNTFNNDEIRSAYCQMMSDILRIPEEDKKIVDIKNIKNKTDYKGFNNYCSVVFRKDGECHGLVSRIYNKGVHWMFDYEIAHLGDAYLFDNIKTKEKNKNLEM